ncbi:transposase [Gimesia sp.]|uniref:transposase n=1 Tax=Gimesia sp. TaxID=2024833 RepID=UPI003A915A24
MLPNGFKSESFQSRLGKLELQVPQTRDGDFYPSTLERSERALKLPMKYAIFLMPEIWMMR